MIRNRKVWGVLLLLALVVVVGVGQQKGPGPRQQQHPWPMFHYDQQRTGVSGGGIPTLDFRWAFTVYSESVFSSPVVDKNWTIYVGSMGPTGGPCPVNCPKLYAINLDGTLKWGFATSAWGKISTAPAISLDGSRIYVFTHESSGQYPNGFAVDAQTGSQIWNLTITSNMFGSSNPVVIPPDKGGIQAVIYVAGNNSFNGKYRLYRIEDLGSSGSIACQIDLPMPIAAAQQIVPSPAVANDGTIYIGAKGDGSTKGALYAINPNCTVKWSLEVATSSIDAGLCPAIKEEGGQERIYIGTTDYRMCVVKENAAQNGGTLAWCYKNPSNEHITTCPAIADLNADGNTEVIFASSSAMSGHVYAINDLNVNGETYPNVLWTTSIPGAIASSPAIGYIPVAPPYQYTVYIGSADRNLYSLAGWDGSTRAFYPTGGMIISSPAVTPQPSLCLGCPGWVFVGSNDGKLYAFGLPALRDPRQEPTTVQPPLPPQLLLKVQQGNCPCPDAQECPNTVPGIFPAITGIYSLFWFEQDEGAARKHALAWYHEPSRWAFGLKEVGFTPGDPTGHAQNGVFGFSLPSWAITTATASQGVLALTMYDRKLGAAVYFSDNPDRAKVYRLTSNQQVHVICWEDWTDKDFNDQIDILVVP